MFLINLNGAKFVRQLSNNYKNLNVFTLQSLKQSTNSTSDNQKEPDFVEDPGTKTESSEFVPNIPDAEEAIEREENFRKYIEKIRDVTRFSNKTAELKYRQQVPTYSDPEAIYLKDQKYFRRIYSRLGKSSGVEPGVAWPHKAELEKMIKEEKEYDLTLEQKINKLIEQKKNEKDDYQKLVKDADDALKKMPKNIESYYQRIVKREKAEEERIAKKKEIMDKAREYYGYEVDIRDPRMQLMVKKIQDEKKAAEKLKKKEEDKKKASMAAIQSKLKEAEKTLNKQEASSPKKNE